MPKRSNWPTAELAHLQNGIAAKATEKLQLLKREQVGSDEEFENRITEYLETCKGNDIRPGVEGLCLFCGISRQTLNNWIHGRGCTARRQKAAQTAKQIILCGLEILTMDGHLNPASSIFYLKNWGGYVDSVEIKAKNQGDEPPCRTIEQIQAEYLRDGAAPLELPEADFSTE